MSLSGYLNIDASVGTSVGSSSAAVQLPGANIAGDTAVLITNVGNLPIYFKLGTASTAAVVNPSGTAVLPGQTLTVDIQTSAFTWIAMMTGVPGCTSTVNLTTGS